VKCTSAAANVDVDSGAATGVDVDGAGEPVGRALLGVDARAGDQHEESRVGSPGLFSAVEVASEQRQVGGAKAIGGVEVVPERMLEG
jgi:hypothetical protein